MWVGWGHKEKERGEELTKGGVETKESGSSNNVVSHIRECSEGREMQWHLV